MQLSCLLTNRCRGKRRRERDPHLTKKWAIWVELLGSFIKNHHIYGPSLVEAGQGKDPSCEGKACSLDQSQVCLEKDWRVCIIFPIEVKGKQVGRYFNG